MEVVTSFTDLEHYLECAWDIVQKRSSARSLRCSIADVDWREECFSADTQWIRKYNFASTRPHNETDFLGPDSPLWGNVILDDTGYKNVAMEVGACLPLCIGKVLLVKMQNSENPS